MKQKMTRQLATRSENVDVSTEILLALATSDSQFLALLLFQILADKKSADLSALILGLTDVSFNKMLVTSIAQEKHG